MSEDLNASPSSDVLHAPGSGVYIRARRESVPRDPKELTDDQKRAAVQSIALIQSIARGRPRLTPANRQAGLSLVLPTIDESRLNHNVLIDGGRGTGKTSVLLNVLKYWINQAYSLVGQHADEVYLHAFGEMIRGVSSSEPDGTVRAKSSGDDSRDKVHREERPAIILPLPIIDLQPLAASTDLRMFLGGSFRRAMEALSPPSLQRPVWAPDTPQQWPAEHIGAVDVRQAWTRFRDVAASGSDHIDARRARLDAVTYAVELEYAESNRQIAGAFSAFIDALRDAYEHSEFTRWGHYRPLFVLPIDDADMNPRLGAQLVETINLLSHNDVAYLLTGDTELFLLLLREHLAAGFRHSLRSVDLESDDTTNIGDLIHLRSLAHQVYDKHIPNAHRCRIDPLPGSERVRRLATDVGSLRQVAGLFEPLPSERMGAQNALRRRTLAYYFDLDEEQPGVDKRTGATERFADSALPDTMRGLEDAREAIAAAARENEAESSIAEVVRYFWRDRINGSLLRGNERRDLNDVVRLEEPDAPRDDDQEGGQGETDVQQLPSSNPQQQSANTEKFAVQNTRLERDIIARSLTSGHFSQEHRWALREILDYELRLRDEGRARVGTPGGPAHPGGLLLPSGVGAALILATDLAADLPTGTFIGKPLSPEEFDSPFVTTSVFIRKEGEYFDFSWPMPDWDSFRDFHIFSRTWAGLVARVQRFSRQQTIQLDHLVFPFIALVASVAYDRHGTSTAADSSDELKQLVDRWRPWRHEPADQESWVRLTGLIKDRVLPMSQAYRRDQDFRHWYYNRLVLLAAPESGLSPGLANLLYDRLLWLREGKDEQGLEETARGARVARANHARIGGGKETGVPIRAFYTDAADVKVDDLLMEIDRSLRKGQFNYPVHERRTEPPGGSTGATAAANVGSTKRPRTRQTPSGEPSGGRHTRPDTNESF